MTINVKNATIEMTKVFAKAASHFGSKEYKELQQARADYPTYKIVTKKRTKKPVDNMKGLTFRYMMNYISKKDAEKMSEFYMLTGKDEDGNAVTGTPHASYGEIKKWFLEEFPELAPKQKERLDKIAAILNKAA